MTCPSITSLLIAALTFPADAPTTTTTLGKQGKDYSQYQTVSTPTLRPR